MYTIQPQFRMSAQEISDYNNLPDNLPDNNLTAKQKDFVAYLYRKYITSPIDNQKWGAAMYKQEQGEKWPSGPRVKDHEAKRFVLGNLVEQQGRKLTDKEAAEKFRCALTCRPMYAKLLNEVYFSK